MSLGLLLFILPHSTFLMQCENYTICLLLRIVILNIKSILIILEKLNTSNAL